MYKFNPTTLEIITSPITRDWMGITDVEPPDYDLQTSSAFFVDGSWEIRFYEPDKEELRKVLQAARDSSLQAITHDFGDGRIVQVRPQDLANFQLAIANGVDREWVLVDNSVAMITVAEMQTAMQSGIAQGEAIWDSYIEELKLLSWQGTELSTGAS